MIRQALLSAALAFVFGAASMAPAAAAPPVPARAALSEAQDSVKVDVRHRRHLRIYDGYGHQSYGGYGHESYSGHRHYRPYRHFRPRHGFSFGIVIGPRYHRPYYDPFYAPRYVVRPRYHHRHAVRIGNPHIRWCYNRYRSYDRWSNTFQPYHGRRRVCVSPYY